MNNAGKKALEKVEKINKLHEEIDSLIDWNSGGGHFLTEDNLTPSLPRDEFIYLNNNKDRPFSEDGIGERRLNYIEERKENLINLKKSANDDELKYLEIRLDDVRLQIENNKIKSRFEILDL